MIMGTSVPIRICEPPVRSAHTARFSCYRGFATIRTSCSAMRFAHTPAVRVLWLMAIRRTDFLFGIPQ